MSAKLMQTARRETTRCSDTGCIAFCIAPTGKGGCGPRPAPEEEEGPGAAAAGVALIVGGPRATAAEMAPVTRGLHPRFGGDLGYGSAPNAVPAKDIAKN
jgi:hypothetical protein